MPSENIGNHIVKNIKFLKQKVKISFKDGEAISIPKEEYPNHYLYKNKSLSEQEYSALLTANDINALYKYALKLVSKHLYSEHKIREKLYLKTNKKAYVDKIIKRLKDASLIDDKEFVKEYVRYADELKYGKNKIIQNLLDKGIFKENIDRIPFPISNEVKKARYWINKLEDKYDDKNYLAKKANIYAFLINKGFEPNVVSQVLDEIKPPKEKQEQSICKKEYEKQKLRLSRKYKGKELKEKIIQNLLSKGYKWKDILHVIGG